MAEQTIYFPKFAEQSFFSQKTIAPPGIKWSAPKTEYSCSLVDTNLYFKTLVWEQIKCQWVNKTRNL